ncbi:putative methyltransferase NSUN7 isoform X2 [Musca autumnalis]
MRHKEKPIFDSSHIQRFSPASSPSNGILDEHRKKCHQIIVKSNIKVNIIWTLEDITKAAKLLKKPPQNVEFSNEYEMRKVYSLIYDVFRYKAVLSKALSDIKFYELYPQYRADENQVWLMLYELHERSFNQRNADESLQETVRYSEAKVKDLSDCLWERRRKLAASISRMRIKYGALQLSNLLPVHLQNEKVAIAATNPVITGWINPFLVRDKESAEHLFIDNGFMVIESDQELSNATVKWDNVCPLFVSCIPMDRNAFATSELVTKNFFIIQDRTFSVGPAVMSRLLDFYDLSGDILQTHIDSPRSTAYLASLFYSVNRLNYFYVYGAGSNLKLYRSYIEDLGINNVRLFAESFTSFPLESNRFRTVVGIFANPPNSFSAISDPIDLICSRGGDLGMLEILTETSISNDGKYRVSLILEEQLRTLSMAMSRPQVQFILYQTHSILTSENQDMIKCAINLVNEAALQKHRNLFLERKRLEALEEAEAANIPCAAMNSSPRKRHVLPEVKQQQGINNNVTSSEGPTENLIDDNEVTLPDIDEFISVDIPDVCKNQDSCLNRCENGCFLSLVQRRQITRLNAKYLIKMAEIRGLFGNTADNKFNKSKQFKAQESSADNNIDQQKLDECSRKGYQNIESLISRLGTPTAASTIRSNLKRASKHKFPMSFDYYSRVCKRRNKVCEMKNWMRRYYQQHKIHNWKMPYPINIIELHI